jgi:hypothetical protein
MPPNSETEDWFNLFRVYISLLTLITYISKKYHSSLQTPFKRRYDSDPTASTGKLAATTVNFDLESTSLNPTIIRRQLLTHYCLCCVRNTEVVAAATVAAMDHDHTDLSDLFNIVVTINPGSKGKYFSQVDANQDVVHVPGKSDWSAIVDSEDAWAFLSCK